MRLRLLAHHFRTGNRVYEGFVPLTSTSGSLLMLLAPRSLGQRTNRAAILEFVDRLHQADIAFLDQVEEEAATLTAH